MNRESPVYEDVQKSNNSVTFSTVAVYRGSFSTLTLEFKHLHCYRNSKYGDKPYIQTFSII